MDACTSKADEDPVRHTAPCRVLRRTVKAYLQPRQEGTARAKTQETMAGHPAGRALARRGPHHSPPPPPPHTSVSSRVKSDTHLVLWFATQLLEHGIPVQLHPRGARGKQMLLDTLISDFRCHYYTNEWILHGKWIAKN